MCQLIAYIGFAKKLITSLFLLVLVVNLYGQKPRTGEIIKFNASIELISFENIKSSNLTQDSLTNYKKPIVIFFWLSSCGPCIKELNQVHAMQEFKALKNRAKIIVVSDDQPKKYQVAKKIAQMNNWKFELFFDKNYALRNTLLNYWYGVPQVMILDEDKKVVLHKIGYTKGDEQKILAQIKLLVL